MATVRSNVENGFGQVGDPALASQLRVKLGTMRPPTIGDQGHHVDADGGARRLERLRRCSDRTDACGTRHCRRLRPGEAAEDLEVLPVLAREDLARGDRRHARAGSSRIDGCRRE
jgi:hypothetical protein